MKINIIAVSFYLNPNLLKLKITKLLEKYNATNYRIIIVNNNSKYNCSDSTVMGTNKAMDYSGYFEGLNCLKILSNNERYIFLNDTFFIKHFKFKTFNRVLKYSELLTQTKLPGMSGIRQRYLSVLFNNPIDYSQYYFSTYIFSLNYPAILLFKKIYSKRIKVDQLSLNKINTYIDFHLTKKLFKHYQNYSFTKKILKMRSETIRYEILLSSLINKNGIVVPVYSSLIERLIFYSFDALFRRFILRFRRNY